MQNWINVKNEDPGLDKWVLVRLADENECKGMQVVRSYNDDGSEEWMWVNEVFDTIHPTHWKYFQEQ